MFKKVIAVAGFTLLLAACDSGVSGKFAGKWQDVDEVRIFTITKQGDHYNVEEDNSVLMDLDENGKRRYRHSVFSSKEVDGYLEDPMGVEKILGYKDKDTLYNPKCGKQDDPECQLKRIK